MTRQVRKKMPARREPAWTRLDDEALLDLRFCDLRLSMARTPLEDSVRRLYGELAAQGDPVPPARVAGGGVVLAGRQCRASPSRSTSRTRG